MKHVMKWAVSVLTVFMVTVAAAAPGYAAGHSALVKKSVATYKKNNYEYKHKLAQYTPQGDYFNLSGKIFQMSRIKMDAKGIPMVKYYDKYQYNPVTIAQMGLSEHGKYVRTQKPGHMTRFLQYADALVAYQQEEGSLRYDFYYEIKHLKAKFQPGWISAMAQGQALSVYSRAYHLTKDVKYLEAGKKCLQFLMKAKSNGGTYTNMRSLGPSYKQYGFFEEYITTPDNFTLNGYVYTLFGLYDWMKLGVKEDYGQKRAQQHLEHGIKVLKVILPKYDIGGFTSYDLSHLTRKQQPHVVPMYHAVHLYQIYGLYTITKDKTFLSYHKRWAKYVD
ncbi:D-glucuronyl C5-epimerase family protein [Fictibacillus iocasae]|uniref:D-glucuronyl C5-epimerase family protein n=1 Tax=Fictibacillus iocasae TaxID=2715437 RepID=A0ABW2NTH3_9BACL